MHKAAVILIVCAGNVAAEECADPCSCEKRAMDPETRDELATGLALFGAAYTIGAFASIAVPAHPADRLFMLTPVFGAIDGAAHSGTPWDARLTLIFSAGVQVAGILFAITAVTLKRPELIEGKKVSVSGNGVAIHF